MSDVSNAINGLRHTVGWGVFWLFCIAMNTCQMEIKVTGDDGVSPVSTPVENSIEKLNNVCYEINNKLGFNGTNGVPKNGQK